MVLLTVFLQRTYCLCWQNLGTVPERILGKLQYSVSVTDIGRDMLYFISLLCFHVMCMCVTLSLWSLMLISRYYVNIFNASGCNELVEKFGSWFSLDGNPRAQIFNRDQTSVTDVDSMIRLMRWSWKEKTFVSGCGNWCRTALWLIRYNNFQEDPLSRCEGCDPPANGENAISARSDLNLANGTYPFGALRQRQHGGTDMKVFIFLHQVLAMTNLSNLQLITACPEMSIEI